MMALMIKDPMDLSKPPWKVILIPNYIAQDGSKQTAFIFKFHHAMADGFNMTRLFFQCLEPAPRWPSSSSNKSVPAAKSRPGVLSLVGNFLSATIKILLCPQDPASSLKATTTIETGPVNSSWCLCEDISVTELKKAAKASGSTINDAILAALAGALRRVHEDKASGTNPQDVQAVIWVSLRHPKEMFEPVSTKVPISMDNANLGCVYVKLPLATDNVKKRLSEMSSRIRPLTQSVEPLVANRLLCFLGTLPAALLTKVWSVLAFKATISMSNICGPQDPTCNFGGVVNLKQIVFFTPPTGTLGIFCNIITMADRPTIAITADARLIEKEHLHKVVHEYFPQELQAIISCSSKNK